MTKIMITGLILITISVILNRFTPLPYPITAVLIGAGFTLLLIGLIPEKKYQALRQLKRKLFTKS